MNITEKIDKYLVNEGIKGFELVEILEYFFDYFSDEGLYDKGKDVSAAEKAITKWVSKEIVINDPGDDWNAANFQIKKLLRKMIKIHVTNVHLNAFQQFLKDAIAFEDVAEKLTDIIVP